MYWRFDNVRAIRNNQWKLYKEDGKPAKLFNLNNDISESNNLAEDEHAIVNELIEKLKDWESTLPPPPGTRHYESLARVDENEDIPVELEDFFDEATDISSTNGMVWNVNSVSDINKFKPLEKVITPNSDGQNDSVTFNGFQKYRASLSINSSSDSSSSSIKIYDLNNRLLRDLQDSDRWDGRDNNGNIVEGGIYIYQYTFNGQTASGSIVVVK